jgi:hypothetical protein
MGGNDMSRYIYGLDPASKNDFFGVVCHELPDGSGTIPRLVAINQLQFSYDKVLSYLNDNLFKRYPPNYIVVDYSNEKTLSDILETKYGKRVEKITFSNQNKQMLKEDGLAILKQGYEFPPINGISNPQAAAYVSTLDKQLKSEQLLATATDKPTFDHPPGQHNDLAIAWELSIHGCLRLMAKGNFIGIGPRDVEAMERQGQPKSGINCVDSDTGQDWRQHEEVSDSHRSYYKPGRS